jgi:hypothetical protein
MRHQIQRLNGINADVADWKTIREIYGRFQITQSRRRMTAVGAFPAVRLVLNVRQLRASTLSSVAPHTLPRSD